MLLVDSIGGLVTGAVAERMGGHGDIVVAHCGLRADPSDITDKFNLSPGIKQTIRRCQIRQLAEGLQGTKISFHSITSIHAIASLLLAQSRVQSGLGHSLSAGSAHHPTHGLPGFCYPHSTSRAFQCR